MSTTTLEERVVDETVIVSEGSDPIILSLRDRVKTWRGLEKEILEVRREDVRTVKERIR